MSEDSSKETLIIIPARGGSKRLPRKNVLPLAGKPLICWTIEAALDANVEGRIVVTSDDDEILAIAQQYQSQGVLLHRRPDVLATDSATTADTILDMVKNQEANGFYAKTVVLLQPTSPLRITSDIEAVVEKYQQADCKKTVVSICEVDHPAAWVGTLGESGELKGITFSGKRSQDYSKEYRLNGAVYVVPAYVVKTSKTLFTSEVLAAVMPRERSWDIDEELDFEICSKIMALRHIM